MGCLSLLQGIFPTQGSNPDLPHCRQILYCLSYQGSPPPSNHLTFISDCGEWEASRCNCQHLSCFSHICSHVEIQNLLPDSLPQFSESPGASQPEGEDGCQPCSRFPAKKKTGKLDMRAPAVGLPWWISGNESTCQCRRPRFDPWVRKIPWRRKWQPTPVFLPGESHGQRILAGYSPWGQKESDTTEQLSTRACTHTRARTLQWLLLIHHSSKSLIKASSGMFLRLLLPTARLALVVLASVIGILPE